MLRMVYKCLDVRLLMNSALHPTVYLETSVLKYAARRREVFVPTEEEINWGGTIFRTIVSWPAIWLSNAHLDSGLRAEIDLLLQIAELAKKGTLELLIHFETILESWGLPKMTNVEGAFFGAPIRKVDGPFQYARIHGGYGAKSQADWMRGLDHKRFKELQVACGAFQGATIAENELKDAFHIWCAESANATFFLTCEKKLVTQVRNHKRFPPNVAVVRPSELLNRINEQSKQPFHATPDGARERRG
jgi:hypothetical protein